MSFQVKRGDTVEAVRGLGSKHKRMELKGNFCHTFHHFGKFFFLCATEKIENESKQTQKRDYFLVKLGDEVVSWNNPEDNASNPDFFQCVFKL